MSETITALVVEPGKRPYTKKIQPGLKSLQREVGGHIEAVYPFPEPVTIVCRESGKLDGCPLNRALRDEAGAIYDVIAGTFYTYIYWRRTLVPSVPNCCKHLPSDFGSRKPL